MRITTEKASTQRRRPPVSGAVLRNLLFLVLGLFALLSVNSIYLVSIQVLEWQSGVVYQDYFYQIMFLLHLLAGLLLIFPFLAFVALHFRRVYQYQNKNAIRAGLSILFIGLAILLSGIILTRFGFFEINDPKIRTFIYWIHVVTPLLVIWAFILHRLAGRKIRWKIGLGWTGVAMVLVAIAIGYRSWQIQNNERIVDDNPFYPSLASTANGELIAAKALMKQDYCAECHEDFVEDWRHSMHHVSSFNNPVYRFSLLETRQYGRDINFPEAARLCAGCHDPVLLFSGEFDQAEIDETTASSQAGITCTACHAITKIKSRRGNADYEIEAPQHYPFTESENPFLKAVNHQLIKAKPAFHKQTFLKPLHKKSEFCSVCHKVHLPAEFNQYKWLRGQNHYDSWLLSGVSGHGVSSFYYPEKAVTACKLCHMPLKKSDDFSANYFDNGKDRKIHDHLFAAANTAIPQVLNMPEWVNVEHEKFLQGTLRLDIFGIKPGGQIQNAIIAPLRPQIPVLEPGKTYLLETVVRTLRLGHWFTQGTSDSNEIWVEVTVKSGGKIIGQSGKMNQVGEVDPWSHFIYNYLLDRQGNRIDRRNAQDIFVSLYDNQIPPGAADVVHYQLKIPENIQYPIEVEMQLQYRKFNTRLMQHVEGNNFNRNNLPVVTIASDRIVFPITTVDSTQAVKATRDSSIPAWERWNDYGIGLLRKGNKGASKGELRQAEIAFKQVEALGQADGALNRARVYLKEGRLEEAARALQKAATHPMPAPPWTVAWFSALVDKQNAQLDSAISQFKNIINTDFTQARARNFDFSRDYRVLNELGQALFERAKQLRGDNNQARREVLLQEAIRWFSKTLEIDVENQTAHYNLALIYTVIKEPEMADKHRNLHLKFKPDDNAAEQAIAIHRRNNPAANHAAESIVIYDLNRHLQQSADLSLTQ